MYSFSLNRYQFIFLISIFSTHNLEQLITLVILRKAEQMGVGTLARI